MVIKNKKMKIGFFMAALLNHGGGAEKHFMMLANAMAKRGHIASLINLDKKFYKKLSFLLSVYYFSKLTFVRYKDKEIKEMLRGVDWLKVKFKELKKTLQKFDVIYVKNEILDLSLLKIIGFGGLPPVIVGIHTPIYYANTHSFHSRFHNFFYRGPLYKWLLKDCKAIRVSNSDARNLITAYYPEFQNKIFTIFNPIDLEKFKPMERQGKGRNFRILFVGRITEQKGIDILIGVVKNLSRTSIFKNLHFTIAGSGELESLVDNLQKKFSNIDFLGHVSQNNMPQLYSSSDVIIVPSRWEGLPNVILEAQSCGIPVIASNISGSNEIIINGKTGFLVENKPDEFVSKIKYFYYLKRKNKNKFISFKINARKNMEKKFNPEKTFNQLEEIFTKIVVS